MEEKLIKTMDLDNGLVLEVYDASKKIAEKGEYQSKPEPDAQRTVEGDIWVVSLVARMSIPVSELFFEGNESAVMTVDAARKVLGDAVSYEKRIERHLVHASEKDQIFEAVHEEFMNGVVRYLAHPEFGKKFVIKRYEEETSPEAVHRRNMEKLQ